MDTQLLKVVGQIAGIGGIALGVFLLLFRDVIRKSIVSKLTRAQSYKLFKLILILVWSVAIAGIVAWVGVTLTRDNGITHDDIELPIESGLEDMAAHHALGDIELAIDSGREDMAAQHALGDISSARTGVERNVDETSKEIEDLEMTLLSQAERLRAEYAKDTQDASKITLLRSEVEGTREQINALGKTLATFQEIVVDFAKLEEQARERKAKARDAIRRIRVQAGAELPE